MVCGSLSSTNRVQLQFTIHIFVDCCFAHGVPWHQENHDKVLESVGNNEIFEQDNLLSHFWGSCNKRLLLLIHVLAFLAIRAYPVGNSGSGYAVLSHKAGNRAPVLNVCTDNFSSGFVWYSSHVLFSSAGIILYQAEVLQIHCTTTILLDVLFEHNHYSELVQKEIQNDLLLTEPEYLTVSLPSANCMKL